MNQGADMEATTVCKTVYPGSIPGVASTQILINRGFLDATGAPLAPEKPEAPVQKPVHSKKQFVVCALHPGGSVRRGF